MQTTTNFDHFFLNRSFQKQAPRDKVESLALLLHMQKVPFQVGKAAVLTKVFCGVSSGTPGKCQDSTPKLYQDCFLPGRPSGRLVRNTYSDTKHKIEFSSVRGGRFGITCSILKSGCLNSLLMKDITKNSSLNHLYQTIKSRKPNQHHPRNRPL
jgi:hypothetical protein